MASGRNSFPRAVSLDRKSFDMHWMKPGDGDRLLAFARSLDEDDLLFMRMDLENTFEHAEVAGESLDLSRPVRVE